MFSEEEKRELRDAVQSLQLREDMRILSKGRYNPFLVNGNVDMDKFLVFLTGYNQFINHTPRAFRKIIDRDMRL